MKAPRLIMLVVVAVMASGCASLRDRLTLGFGEVTRIERGEDHFRKVCAACHGQGTRPSPNPAAPPVERIARRYSATGLGRELEAIAEVGHYGMPVLRISPRDRRDVVAFVASLKPAGTAP